MTYVMCLDCGADISDPAKPVNAYEGVRSICNPCIIKRIRKAQEAARKQQEEIEREEHRAQVVADRHHSAMLRRYAEAQRAKRDEENLIVDEGGVIPCL